MAITIKKANMPKTDRGKENAPAAERRGATRERGTAIIAIAAIAAVSAAIGYTIHDACERRGISEAREACDSAIVELSGAANGYTSLLEADGTTAASQLEPNDVKDPKTIDSLKKAMLAGNPAAMKCDVSKAVELNSTAAKARKETETMKANTEALNTAVKAVESSKLDKTVDDASQLLNDSSGKVQDPKTRDELAKAIETRDSETIGKAMKTVGESMTAKKKRTKRKREEKRNRKPPPRPKPRQGPRNRLNAPIPMAGTAPRAAKAAHIQTTRIIRSNPKRTAVPQNPIGTPTVRQAATMPSQAATTRTTAIARRARSASAEHATPAHDIPSFPSREEADPTMDRPPSLFPASFVDGTCRRRALLPQPDHGWLGSGRFHLHGRDASASRNL